MRIPPPNNKYVSHRKKIQDKAFSNKQDFIYKETKCL